MCSFGASANPNWKNIENKDEMTGKKSYAVISKDFGPTRTMGFPYNNTISWITLYCDKKRNRVTFNFGFNTAPNISNAKIIKKNFNKIKTRIKFGQNITQVDLLQNWGGKNMVLVDFDKYKEDFINSDELLLELNWYDIGNIYFKYSTKGSSKALSGLKNRCGI